MTLSTLFLRSQVLVDPEIMSDLTNKVDRLSEELSQLSSNPSHVIYDNKGLCELLDVDGRTLQKWRDKRLITFSQLGRKFYYRLTDVLDMLEEHRVERVQSISSPLNEGR